MKSAILSFLIYFYFQKKKRVYVQSYKTLLSLFTKYEMFSNNTKQKTQALEQNILDAWRLNQLKQKEGKKENGVGLLAAI